MKILVFSDSHGRWGPLLSLIETETPDAVFHLGDHLRDLDPLIAACPNLLMVGVPGNCDYVDGQDTRTVNLGGARFFLCHGHQYGVRRDTRRLERAAREAGAQTALFGHTHIAHCALSTGGLWVFNPGSLTEPRGGSPSYGTIELSDGEIRCTIHRRVQD